MWKAFLVLSCLCALAHAQNRGRAPSTTSRAAPAATTTRAAPAATTLRPAPAKPSAKPPPSQLNAVVVESNPNAKPALNFQCPENNGRYPIPGSCDKYIECSEGIAEEMQCADGLRYNPNLSYKSYPCVYPNEYECLERAALQPAQPTDECPHQFGYYKLGDERNCTWFRNCVNGVGYDIACPEGLAFNSLTYRCEWPDEVPDCDAAAFLGFRCPELRIPEEFGPPEAYKFYRSDDDCQKFYMCIETKPRILRCGGENAFDEHRGTCVSADEVESCPQELKLAAKSAREAEKLRFDKEVEFNANPPQSKKRLTKEHTSHS